MGMRALAALVLAGLGLAACAGATTVTQRYSHTAHERYYEAAEAGPIALVVAGAPGGRADGAFAARLAAMIAGNYGGVDARFSADPARATAARYRFALGFGPAALDASRLCAGGASIPDGGGVQIGLAFCDGERALIEARARASGADLSDEAALGRIVRQALADMFVTTSRHGIGARGFSF